MKNKGASVTVSFNIGEIQKPLKLRNHVTRNMKNAWKTAASAADLISSQPD
jgi:hypothetical protein